MHRYREVPPRYKSGISTQGSQAENGGKGFPRVKVNSPAVVGRGPPVCPETCSSVKDIKPRLHDLWFEAWRRDFVLGFSRGGEGEFVVNLPLDAPSPAGQDVCDESPAQTRCDRVSQRRLWTKGQLRSQLPREAPPIAFKPRAAERGVKGEGRETPRLPPDEALILGPSDIRQRDVLEVLGPGATAHRKCRQGCPGLQEKAIGLARSPN